MQLNTLGLAHRFLTEHIHAGDTCIDATAGRGRDTALLCRLTGRTGRVLAFDIQEEALRQTRELLAREGLTAELHLDSHANMGRYLPPESVRAIVFNFGRLPGGDPTIFTTEKTSLPAIEAGLSLLAPGGVMSLSIYYGGENGYSERDALLSYLAALDARKYTVLTTQWANRPHDPPMAVFLWKGA